MNQNKVDLLDLLATINAGKRLILGSTLVLCILAGGVSLVLPNVYTAEVQLLPPKEQKKGFGFADLLSGLPIPSLRLGEKGTPADIFVAILKSPTMRRRLVQDFDLMSIYEAEKITDAIETLKDNTEIGKSEEGTIMIKVADRDPRRAADIANNYVVLLDSTNKSLTQTSAKERYDFIQKLIRREEDKLNEAMDGLQRFQAEHNAISIEEQAKSVIRAAAEMQVAAMELLIGRNSLLLSGFSTTHPQVQKLEQEFHLRQEALAFLRDGANESQDFQSNIGAELQLEENLFLPLRDIPEVAQQFALVEKDVLVQAALLKMLLEQEAEALIEASNETSTVQVLDPATIPEVKSAPSRLLIVFITAILSLFATISYLFGAIYMRTLKARWRSDYPERA
jgi:tyrosine-protein kinase Etk/Wzc